MLHGGRRHGRKRRCSGRSGPFTMPHKANAARRHYIPRPKRRVTNWAENNEALRQRGSLTVWFTDEAIAAWKAAPQTTPGAPPGCSRVVLPRAHAVLSATVDTEPTQRDRHIQWI